MGMLFLSITPTLNFFKHAFRIKFVIELFSVKKLKHFRKRKLRLYSNN